VLSRCPRKRARMPQDVPFPWQAPFLQLLDERNSNNCSQAGTGATLNG